MASAVATPLEKQFSTIAGIDSMTSTSTDGLSTITLQFSLDRNIDAAAQDVQSAIAAAAQIAAVVDAHAADAAQGQSRRRADPEHRPVVVDACRCRRSTSTPRTCWRSRSRPSAASRRCRCTARSSTRCASSSIPMRWRRAASRSPTSSRPSATATSTCRPARSTARDKATSVQATGQLMNAQAYAPLIVAYRNGAPVRLNEIGRVFDSVQNDKIAAWYNGTRGIMLAVQRQPGHEHHRDRRCDAEDSADLRSATPAVDQPLRVLRPLGFDPRIRARRAAVAAARAGARRCGDFRVPAQRLGDDHSQPRAADVDRRHVRVHVRVRLQPRQPVADGADAVRRLRRRRRDRDAGEHHASHGDGQVAAAGDARRLEGNRLHHRVDDACRWSRCSSRCCSWAASSAACCANSR